MKKKTRKHKPQRFFVQLFIDTMESPAWRDMSPIARLLYIALKKRYNRRTQQAVFLSVRTAAEELNFSKNTITPKYRELEHHGFIRRMKSARFSKASGKAAHYQLTDEPYEGKPPSMNFACWNGVSFNRSVPIRGKLPKVSQFLGQFVPILGTQVSQSVGHPKKAAVKKAREMGVFQKPKRPNPWDISRF
jgi:hypothetical protein